MYIMFCLKWENSVSILRNETIQKAKQLCTGLNKKVKMSEFNMHPCDQADLDKTVPSPLPSSKSSIGSRIYTKLAVNH